MLVKIKDFNCIENIELDFQPGFTILQGPSNSGKSSIIKAIENAIFNQSGTTNVRQGATNYSVGIKHNDHTVSLIKGKNTKYKVDDNIFEKIGVSQLPEVADALNIRETILGGEKVRLNFSRQMSYPFLLDKTPGQMYRFIVDSSESESLSNVLKDMAKDIKDIEKSIVQNEAKMDILVGQQTKYNSELSHADEIIEVVNQILDLDPHHLQLLELDKTSSKYLTTKDEITSVSNHLQQLQVDVDTQVVDQLQKEYIDYTNLYKSYTSTNNDVIQLKNHLSSLDISISTAELDKQYNDFKTLNELVEKYWQISQEVYTIGSQLNTLGVKIDQEKEKLDGFNICPLCGGELKC